MVNRGVAFTLTAAVALVFSAGLFAQKRDDRKQDEALRKEVQGAVKLVDEAIDGHPASNDAAITWLHQDMMKATNKKQYVPFTVSIDPSKVREGKAVFYWRVLSKAGKPAPSADDPARKRIDYPFEDMSVVQVKSDSTPLRISRSFVVPTGEYDIYIVVKEFTSNQKKAAEPKASLLKQAISVPDLWNGELSTSSVIVTQRIDPLPAPLTPQQQVDRPYALGNMELIPAFDLKFSKTEELATFVLIYNPKADAMNKPDVTVEYNFYEKSSGAEKFFNKTPTQNLNARTLPPTFDLTAGAQLQSGQAVPLASFPEGEYRLEIKITDKLGNKIITRDVNFSVTAS